MLLAIPDIDIADPAAAAQDESVKAVLVEAVEGWTRVIAQVTGAVSDRDKGTRPLHEIEFWRGRNTTLSTMYEQLNNTRVRPILDALELAREPARELFRTQFGELSKAYVQARDNVKFLNTLERHFKSLATGSFSVMLDTLPSLMNGLRMVRWGGVAPFPQVLLATPAAPPLTPSQVWVISRHYNTDDQMLPLMRRIVHELVDKVTSEVRGGPQSDRTPRGAHTPPAPPPGLHQADPQLCALQPRGGHRGHDAGQGRARRLARNLPERPRAHRALQGPPLGVRQTRAL